MYTEVQCSLCEAVFDWFSDEERAAETAGTSSSVTNTGQGAATHSPAPAGPEPSAPKAGEGEGEAGQVAGEDKENDAAAVTAVIWKELAELSAVQAKLKVFTPLALLFVGAEIIYPAGIEGEGEQGGKRGLAILKGHAADSRACKLSDQACTAVLF